MKTIVDTSVWSLALRRGSPLIASIYLQKLVKLINSMKIGMIGPIRQEILSGIKSESQFIRLKEELKAFPDIPLVTEDFELAAELFNHLRSKGIQGSNTDFIICAVSIRHSLQILTSDKDFIYFANHIPIKLYPISEI